jgi:hypothetical protein
MPLFVALLSYVYGGFAAITLRMRSTPKDKDA